MCDGGHRKMAAVRSFLGLHEQPASHTKQITDL
jgi:hypothetical protein